LIEDWINEISRVTNAGHASITSKGETKSVKIFSNSSLFVVASDNLRGNNLLETKSQKLKKNYLRTRGERGLDVSGNGETLEDSVLGKETSSKHNTWVGGVGARGNSCNENLSVGEGVFFTLELVLDSKIYLISRDTKSLESDWLSETFSEFSLNIADGNSIHWALRTSKRGDDCREVELEDSSRIDRVLL